MYAFLVFILLPVVIAVSPNEHRIEMLKGIESIPVLGTPGTMAVWGEHSFAVIIGKEQSQPIAAASTFGDGRFFAIAHGSYVGGIRDGSADLFMTQVVSWVSQKKNPKIGTLANNTKNWNEVDILLWGQNMQLSSSIEAKLLHWIDQGGGVIASACPWGWAQVTGKNLQTDLSQNRVMAKFGMQYGGNYAKGIGGLFQMKPIHDETNASIALQAIETEGMCTLIGSGAVQYAVQLSPTFRKKVNAVIEADELHGPSKNAPVNSTDIRRRLFVTNFSSDWTSLQVDKVVAASGSDVFPGTVDASFPRVREDLQLDSSVGGWQSTGMYVCPGEKLIIDVKSGSSDSWSIRIGCHKDTLWHKGTWTRWPAITHVKKLEQHLEVATPWGGLVYFEANKSAGDLKVSVAGVVEAPLFDVDSTTTDWKIERNNPAPWAEIKGHHMILSVPSSAVRTLDNPEDVATFWDTVVRSHCELAGIEVPSRPERFVADQQISAGYMHSGYPIMTGVDVATPKNGKLARVVDVVDLKKRGSWGHFHELGHNRQRGWWTFAGTGEVTCNLFSLHAGEVLCGIEPWENAWLKGQLAGAKNYLIDGADFSKWKSSPGIALVSYVQIQREFGWEPFTAVFKEYEILPANQRPKDNQAKMDEWVLRVSIATQQDLRPFYRSWGMPLSDSLLANETLNAFSIWIPEPL